MLRVLRGAGAGARLLGPVRGGARARLLGLQQQQQQQPPPAPVPAAVGRWLLACSGAVAGAVVLGGVTR